MEKLSKEMFEKLEQVIADTISSERMAAKIMRGLDEAGIFAPTETPYEKARQLWEELYAPYDACLVKSIKDDVIDPLLAEIDQVEKLRTENKAMCGAIHNLSVINERLEAERDNEKEAREKVEDEAERHLQESYRLQQQLKALKEEPRFTQDHAEIDRRDREAWTDADMVAVAEWARDTENERPWAEKEFYDYLDDWIAARRAAKAKE
jgi:hypothetical protein